MNLSLIVLSPPQPGPILRKHTQRLDREEAVTKGKGCKVPAYLVRGPFSPGLQIS